MNSRSLNLQIKTWAQFLGLLMFGMGVLMLIMGGIITFYPGADRGWYVVCAVLLSGGLLTRPLWLRVLAGLLILLAVYGAAAAHPYAEQYDRFIREEAKSAPRGDR